ncbi:MAG TPA: hypothetical protein VIM12_01820 [Noviherbaspirillum sp.]|jgi:hypothetical protein|uniref:hypothetical protein n=1 Tax=Noviherbaspirillum sp. TaxID=1926288 RepID=UPI002F92DB73
MHTKNDKRQQLIDSAFRRASGNAAADDGVHALRRWRQLSVKLVPLVGDAGFTALYARALRLAAADQPGITVDETARTIDALFRILDQDLAAAAGGNAANTRLIEIFTGLLAALVGDALTNSILASAWVEEQNGMETKEKRK